MEPKEAPFIPCFISKLPIQFQIINNLKSTYMFVSN